MWQEKNMDSCFRRNDIKRPEKQLQNEGIAYRVWRSAFVQPAVKRRAKYYEL